jgi:5-methyltetrahydropteroyltriglutamate--homocysteine methyltransferase
MGATPKYLRPICTGPISVKDAEPLRKDIARMKAALAAAGVSEGFMNGASPGTIAMFQPNQHYPSHQAYLEALATAMRAEYETIVGAGLLLQVDCPDLAMGRHVRFRDASETAPGSRRRPIARRAWSNRRGTPSRAHDAPRVVRPAGGRKKC